MLLLLRLLPRGSFISADDRGMAKVRQHVRALGHGARTSAGTDHYHQASDCRQVELIGPATMTSFSLCLGHTVLGCVSQVASRVATS